MNGAMAPKPPIRTWLFNPFHYVAGGTALGVGLGAILLSAVLGYMGNIHLDGVLDYHAGAPFPFLMYIAEGVVAWLSMAAVMLGVGKLVSKTPFRAIDVLGTQALARAPMLLAVAAGLLPGFARYTSAVAEAVANVNPTDPNLNPREMLLPSGTSMADALTAAGALLCILAMTVWMVLLMYRAYAVSCNVSGGAAIGAFIGGLVGAEVISKVLLIGIMVAFSGGLGATPIDPAEAEKEFSFNAVVEGEACVKLLASQDYDRLIARLDARMKSALSKSKLEKVWQETEQRYGAFQEMRGTELQKVGAHIAANVTCAFEQRETTIRVVFDRSGKVAGLWIE